MEPFAKRETPQAGGGETGALNLNAARLANVLGEVHREDAVRLFVQQQVVVAGMRGRVMQKMQAGTLADLVRMAEKLDLPLRPRP